MIHRKFLLANENKHLYGNLTKYHIPSCCTCLSAKKGEDRNFHRNMDMKNITEVNWLTKLVTRLRNNQNLPITNIMTSKKFYHHQNRQWLYDNLANFHNAT